MHGFLQAPSQAPTNRFAQLDDGAGLWLQGRQLEVPHQVLPKLVCAALQTSAAHAVQMMRQLPQYRAVPSTCPGADAGSSSGHVALCQGCRLGACARRRRAGPLDT